MSKSSKKPLNLNTETLQALSGAALEVVAGGQATSITSTITTVTRTLSRLPPCVTV